MDYLARMAHRSFKTGPQGEMLFFIGGPWSRPLVLPNEEHRRRVYTKCLWMQRTGAVLYCGVVVLLVWVPDSLDRWVVWLGLGGLLVIWEFSRRIVFTREMRTLARLEHRLSLRAYYGQLADWYSKRELSFLMGLWIFMAGLSLWGAIRVGSTSLGGTVLLGLCCASFVVLGIFHGLLLYLGPRTRQQAARGD